MKRIFLLLALATASCKSSSTTGSGQPPPANEAAKAFDPNSGRNTLIWLASWRHEPDTGNRLAQKSADEKWKQHIQSMVGKKIRWEVRIRRIASNGGVFPQEITWPQNTESEWLDNRTSKTGPDQSYSLGIQCVAENGIRDPDNYPNPPGFQCSNAEWLRKAKSDDSAILEGTITYATTGVKPAQFDGHNKTFQGWGISVDGKIHPPK